MDFRSRPKETPESASEEGMRFQVKCTNPALDEFAHVLTRALRTNRLRRAFAKGRSTEVARGKMTVRFHWCLAPSQLLELISH